MFLIKGMAVQAEMDLVEQEENLSQESSSQSGETQTQTTRKAKTVQKKKAPEHPCLCCGDNCAKGQPAVKCVLCELWAHKNCIKMPESTYKQLEQQYRETNLAYWVCRPCQNFSQRVKHQFEANDKRHLETEARVENNSKRIDRQDKEIEDMKEAMRRMAETMEREKEARDAMVCDEMQEMEARRRNLIIHGLQEAPSLMKANRERIEWDKTYVENCPRS